MERATPLLYHSAAVGWVYSVMQFVWHYMSLVLGIKNVPQDVSR